MKEEDELVKKCGTKNPFMVPEGYFDNFSKELMNKLPEKEQTSAPQETITTWQRIKPWIYYAAAPWGSAQSALLRVLPCYYVLFLCLSILTAPDSGRVAAMCQTLNRKCMMSPSCTTYSLPSMPILPASRHAFSEPSAT